MNLLAASLLLSVLCYLGISQSKSQSMSLNDSWSKKFTFRFIELSDFFIPKIRVTPKTNGTTLISIPCLNIQRQLLTHENRSLSVQYCDTIKIFSTADVTVHGMGFTSHGLTAGFLALPHDELGTEYLIDCYTPRGNKSAQVTISAIFNSTTVTVDCESNCTFNHMTLSGPVELGAGESGILRKVVNNTEMTGTYIRSDKPISVIVGAANVLIPRGYEDDKGKGVILEQLLPISSWGHVHIVPPFNETSNGWILRILAINESTDISTTGCGENASRSITMHSKEYRDITVNGESTNLCVVEANRPIQVMQYIASSEKEEYGDPSMTIIPPVIDYHGNTTLRVMEATETTQYFADVIVAAQQKELFLINWSSVSESSWRCVNITSHPTGASASAMTNESFCHYSTALQNGTYYMTHLQQSAKFWVRIYTFHSTVGAAMLADIGLSASIKGTTETKRNEEEFKNMITDLDVRFPGDFPNYEEAEKALGNFISYLLDREELESANETNNALDYFTGVLKRHPLTNATVDDAKSFLNRTSDAVNVLFSSNTNEHLSRACSQKETIVTSSAEDAQHELERLMTQASALIVDGGISSFGVSRENAAFVVSSTNEATSPDMASALEDCEGALEVPGYDVSIPCEVVREMRSRAMYQIMLPFGGDVITSSKCGGNKTRIGSSLLSIGLVSNQTEQRFKKNISLSFVTRSLEVDVRDNNTLCSFWNYTESNWSTSGCTLGSLNVTGGETTVMCLCNHLTSFAVLIDVSPGEVGEVNLKIMKLLTWIGCSFSIAACFLTCFGYAFLRLRSDLILIHGNLALAVGLAETAFLCLGAVTDPSEKPIPCIVIASFIYYHFMAMFAWMAIEGIHLYLLTFVVWNAEKRKIKYYMACGWGIPIIFVVAMLAVHFNSNQIVFKNYCFLSMADNFLLFFIVPVAVVIVFNIFVTIRVVIQIIKMADGPTMQSDIKTRAKYGVKAMVVLLPIMGLTWIVGFLAIDRAKVVFLYIFIVLNCLQGVFIFFIHFFRNSEVRKAIRRQRERWAISYTWYAESSSVSKNRRKSSSSGAEKNPETLRSPMQTMTLSNIKTNNI